MTAGTGSWRIAHDVALELSAAALDFPLPADRRAALDAHLEDCVSCRRTAVALAADARALQRLTSVGSPSVRPLMAVIDAASARPRRRMDRAWTIVAAAALLLAIGAGALLGGGLNSIRRPLGLDPLAIVWTRLADPGVLDANLPGSRVSTLLALPLPGSPVLAAGSRGGEAAIWIQRDGRIWERIADRDLGRGRIEAVAAAGGRIVAVGASVGRDGLPAGRIWESTDGWSWDVVELDAMRTVEAVAATPSFVVAAGIPRSSRDAPVWISVGGGDWRPWDPGTLPRSTITGLTVGGPGFVAVGYDDRGGRAWTSPDGRSWTPSLSTTFQRGRLTGVAATPAGLVAVGWTTDASEHTTPTAWVSRDGDGWSRISVDSSARDGRLQAVSAWSDGILAVGGTAEGSAAWGSEDGRTWQRLDSATVSGVPGLVAVGPYGEHVLVAGTGSDGPSIWSGQRP